MSRLRPLLARIWILLLVAASFLLLWIARVHIEHVDYVTGIAQESIPPSFGSATGYLGGRRQLIVPEHINRSYEWVQQTQQMFADHALQVRHVDYDNAPQGRAVYAASAYRWYLGAVALMNRFVSEKPIGQAVERAALHADPLLYLLFLVGTVTFAARKFGPTCAAIVILSAVGLFPFAAGFLPGVPDEFSLLLVLAPWMILPLIAGLRAASRVAISGDASAKSDGAAPRWFAFGGVVGALGLWINVAIAVPFLVGVGLGGLFAAASQRRWRGAAPGQSLPGGEPVHQKTVPAPELIPGLDPRWWRIWALAGAVATLILSLLDYPFATLANFELRAIHPLYGVGWLGGGELLYRFGMTLAGNRAVWRPRGMLAALGAIAALAAVPAVMWKTGNLGFLAVDLQSFRLTKQWDGIMAPNLLGWPAAPGASSALWATLLPIAILVLSPIIAFRRGTSLAHRAAILIAVGPVAVAMAFGYFHLRWWQMTDAALLALIVATTWALCVPSMRLVWRRTWSAVLAVVLCVGVAQVLPKSGTATKNVLTVPEAEGLVERDLAQWLATHSDVAGGPVVLAPPSVTSALCFYGGVRGLGSLDWENKEGLSVALRIVISTSREEALALIRKRGVTHIVMPSWDDFFSSYLAPASVQTGELFYASLDRWSIPSWLRPIPYQIPGIGGFESHTLRVFEVVEDQSDPIAASRLAEYFIEMGQVDNAKLADQLLRRYPNDLSTWIARGQLYSAIGDSEAFGPVLETILKRLAAGGDRFLPWERRVSLAVVLARGQRLDLAKAQVERALREIDEARLRSLTTYSLFHFMGLVKGFRLSIADKALNDLALELLPAELRDRVR